EDRKCAFVNGQCWVVEVQPRRVGDANIEHEVRESLEDSRAVPKVNLIRLDFDLTHRCESLTLHATDGLADESYCCPAVLDVSKRRINLDCLCKIQVLRDATQG